MKREPLLLRRLADYLWGFKLTRFGQILVVFGLLAGLFLSLSVEILTFDLFIVMFAVGFLALLLNVCWRTRLETTLRLPDRVAAGTVVQGVARIRNAGRRPVYDVGASLIGLPPGLREAMPDIYIEALAPGETAEMPIAIRVARRGSYVLPPLRAFTAFPLRLARSGVSRCPAGTLLALPAFTPADGVAAPVGMRYQPGGVALAANVGESPDYIGNREYRPGDSIRRVDMRAWGRVGEPVVREYHEEYFLRVALVLDTYVAAPRWRRRRANERLEAAISLTATLVDGLSRGEYLLDVFAAGPQLYNVRAGRGAARFGHVLEILACLEACRANPFDIVTPALADELAQISTVLFVFLDWDEARRAMLRTAVERGCRCRVFIVHAGDTAQPVDADEETSVTFLTPEQVWQGRLGVL